MATYTYDTAKNALLIAATECDVKQCYKCIKRGATFDATDDELSTALHKVAAAGCEELVAAFIKAVPM